MKFLFPIAPNQVFETPEDGKANELRSLVLYQDDNFHFHFDNNFEGKPNSSLLIKSEMRQSGVDVRPCFAPLSRTGLFLGQKAKSIAGQLAAGRMKTVAHEFVVWGGRGHAKVIRDLLALNEKRVVAIIDNDHGLPSPFSDVNIFYGEDGFRTFLKSRESTVGTEIPLGGVVAIGKMSKERVDIYELIIHNGLEVENLIHSSSVITNPTLLGKGLQILANVFVGSASKLGDFCIVNSGSIVDHDCVLGRGVHIAPGAVVTGEIEVGDFAFIGANATVLPGCKIGANVIVGAGSVVTRDIPNGLTVVGSPATEISQKNFSSERS